MNEEKKPKKTVWIRIWLACIAALIIIGIFATIMNRADSRDRRYLCISQGYADAIYWNRTHLCIGIRGGEFIVEPVASLADEVP